MKILIFGLPGSGKTWLAKRLVVHLENCAWYNADMVRGSANDWDFSPEGRLRQANRMRTVADFEKSNGRWVVCDFVAPTENTRKQFDPDITIWLNTITEGRFEDTNKMFESPEDVNYKIDRHLSDDEIKELADGLKKEIADKSN